jgi:hypothetical protein
MNKNRRRDHDDERSGSAGHGIAAHQEKRKRGRIVVDNSGEGHGIIGR